MLILCQAGAGEGKEQLELQCVIFLWHNFLTSPGASLRVPSQSPAPLSLRSHFFNSLPSHIEPLHHWYVVFFCLVTHSQLHLLLPISSTDTVHVEVTIMFYLSCNYHPLSSLTEEILPSLLHIDYIHSLTDLWFNLKRNRDNLVDLGFPPRHKHFPYAVPLHPS